MKASVLQRLSWIYSLAIRTVKRKKKKSLETTAKLSTLGKNTARAVATVALTNEPSPWLTGLYTLPPPDSAVSP